MKKFSFIDYFVSLPFIFLVLVTIGIACTKKTPVEPEDDFLKIPEYSQEEPKPSYITVTRPDSTYWYVILQADGVVWHGTVNLGTPYFDFAEARRQFGDAKGRGYFKFILQIDKESIKSFDEMK